MRRLLRSIGAVAAGMVVAFAIVLAAEIVNSRFYPLPAGVDLMSTNSVREAVANLPNSAFVLILLGWAFGTFLGAGLASRLARQRLYGGIVGGLLLIVGVLNMIALPHPGWVWAVGLAAFPASGYAGTRLGTRSRE